MHRVIHMTVIYSPIYNRPLNRCGSQLAYNV